MQRTQLDVLREVYQKAYWDAIKECATPEYARNLGRRDGRAAVRALLADLREEMRARAANDPRLVDSIRTAYSKAFTDALSAASVKRSGTNDGVRSARAVSRKERQGA